MSVELAKYFAIAAHEAVGQKRKYNGEPYWYHCQRVASLVPLYNETSEMIAAAWLHDVVEDTQIQSQTVHDVFGFNIGIMVDTLTNDKTCDRELRKDLEIERFKYAPNGQACMREKKCIASCPEKW